MNAHPRPPLFFVVPDAIDDPERVSGGNVYDQRIRDGLAADGWDVRMRPVAASTPAEPSPTRSVPGATDRALSALLDAALVLIDGLLVAREPDALLRHGRRLTVVVLAHMIDPALPEAERAALRAANRIIATSRWTRGELIAQDAADPHAVVVAHPGTDPVFAKSAARHTRRASRDEAPATESGGRLLCVATVAPHKGHDLLLQALARLADLPGWSCTIAGSLQGAPDFVAELRTVVASAGLTDRVTFTGVLTGRALEDAYAHADLVVLPSRAESYGMAVADALARGIPVLASDVGGVTEAVGDSGAGMFVPPDDAWALEVVLRQWLTSRARRDELTAAAMRAREHVRPWSATTSIVAETLAEAAGVASDRTEADHSEAGARS